MVAIVFVKIIFMIFFMLLPLANPIITVAIMMGVSGRLSLEEKHKQAKEAAYYSFAVMMISFYCGQLVMSFFGISIPGLRIAGGLIVMSLGFQMLFPGQAAASSPELESKKDEMKERSASKISFIPLTMPGFAGPGTIAMLISIASTLPKFDAPKWVMLTAPTFSFISLCFMMWLCLRSSEYIMKKIGQSGIEAISRIMGFILVCMGVQFGINGVLELIEQISMAS